MRHLLVTPAPWLTRRRRTPVQFTATIRAETPKAFLLVRGDAAEEEWWPKSAIAFESYDPAKPGSLSDATNSAHGAPRGAPAPAPTITPGAGVEPPSVASAPWAHQVAAFQFAYDKPAAMLAMEMGTGKTRVVLDLIAARGHKSVLILCPKSVVSVWPGEFEKHHPGLARVRALENGSVTNRLAEAQRNAAAGGTHATVINYEAAWREPFRSWALSQAWDLVVLDESHRIKAPGGRASMFCARLRDHATYRLGLSGTPMAHSPLDVYAQYRALDSSIYGTSFARFRARYAVMGGYGNHQVTGYQNEEELQDLFYSIAHRVRADDVLDLPLVLDLRRETTLEPGARAVYDVLERDLVVDVKEGRITAANALVRLLRLQQVTSGEVPTEEGTTASIGTEKRDLLEDILTDLAPDEPVVVFCRFRHDLGAIAQVGEKLGRGILELSGTRNDLAAWQTGQAPILAAQIQSGSLGVDLTRAHYAVYYSLGFSLGEYEQSRARLHRPGQQTTVRYIHLVCKNTVDVRVLGLLHRHQEVVRGVLDGYRHRL